MSSLYLYYTIKIKNFKDWKCHLAGAILAITNKVIGGLTLEKEWILMVQQNQLGNLLKTNQKTEKFGLSISDKMRK